MWCKRVKAVLLASAILAAAGVARAAVPPTEVVATKVRGLVFYTDGRTPAEGVPVRVWDVDKRGFVYETQTDENGMYRIPEMPPGRYLVAFDWTMVDLQFAEKLAGGLSRQPLDIIVVIPRVAAFSTIQAASSVLIASGITETARRLDAEQDRTTIVSP
jgi:hypothetical protein